MATATDESPAAEPTEPGTEDISHADPPSPETVHAWLAQARPADVLKLLRKPDFAYITMTAFAGARVNSSGYTMPLVRGRLVQEAVKNDKFAEKLRAAAEAALSVPPVPEASAPLPNPIIATAEREQVKAERERAKTLKAERDNARQALADAEASVRAAQQLQQQAEAGRAEAERLSQEQSHKTGRLERRLAQLQQDIVTLTAERDARQKPPKQAPPPTIPNGVKAPTPAVSPWQVAAAHLLNRGKTDAVVILAEEVLRLAPESTAALGLAAQAHEARQEGPQASVYIKTLLDQALAQGRTSDAADAWLRLVRLSSPSQAERGLLGLLRVLKVEDTSGIRQMRLSLTRLQGQAPAAYAQASEQINRLASPALAQALMPLPGALGDDDKLPLDLPTPPTAAQLITAVRAGNALAVTEAREALSRLADTSRDDFERARAALERTAGPDPSLVQPLMRTPRGAAVVDASNVALHGQEMLVSPRPRLNALLAMRRALLQRGFFPVMAIADANLPHLIDEPQAFEQARARREVVLVLSGTAADTTLISEAKRLAAPIVTNDRMEDWDPEHLVTKIHFTFSHNGDVLFDS